MSEIQEKVCISCGMPMREESEFAGGDPSKDYCCYCADAEGNLKSYDERKADMTEFIMKTQGFEHEAAEKIAVESMAKQPAWQK